MTELVPDEWISAALDADTEWMRASRSVVFRSPARDQVRSMLRAAVPLIRADERSQIRTLAIEEGAVCTDSEGAVVPFAAFLGGEA